MNSNYYILEVLNITVNIIEGNGYVEVWQHDVMVGDTKDQNIFPIDSGVPVKFVAYPYDASYSFDKFCVNNDVTCVRENPFQTTFSVSGNINAYFILSSSITDVAIHLRDNKSQDVIVGSVILDAETKGTDPTGTAVFYDKAYGNYTVIGSAINYNSKSKDITVNKNNNDFYILLVPISTPTPTPSQTPSPTPTPSQTPSPTPSQTPSPTPSQTPSPTPSQSPSPTPSPSPYPTPIPTIIPPLPTIAPGKCPTDPIGCLFCSVFRLPVLPGYPFEVSDNCQTNIAFPFPFKIPTTPQPTKLSLFLNSILRRR